MPGKPRSRSPVVARGAEDDRDQHRALDDPNLRDVGGQPVAEGIPEPDAVRHEHHRPERVRHEERPKAQARGSSQRTCHEPQAGEEAAQEHGEGTVTHHEAPHGLHPFGVHRCPLGDTCHGRGAIPSAQPVADVVPSYGTDYSGRENDGEPKVALPYQIARDDKGCFLWHRQADIAQHDHDEDGRVAPIGDELAEIRHTAPMSHIGKRDMSTETFVAVERTTRIAWADRAW